MKGVEALFLISFEHPDQLALQANVIEAARKAGVRMIARLSASSADPSSPDPLIRNHGLGDRQLAQSGLGHVLIRPQWFNQNFLTYCPGGIIRLPAGEARLPFVDVRDIAAVTIKALSEPGHDGKAYVLTGPEALSHSDVAAILSAATGKRFVYEDIAPEIYRQELIEEGASAYYAELILNLARRPRVGFSLAEPSPVPRGFIGQTLLAFPLVLCLRLGHGLPLHVPDRIGAAFAERDDVVLDPARASPIGLAGRRAGIQSLEFLRHPAAALIVVRVRGGTGKGRRQRQGCRQ